MYPLPFLSAFIKSSDFFLPTEIGNVLPGNTVVFLKGSIGINSFSSDSSISVSPSKKSPVMNDIFPSEFLS